MQAARPRLFVSKCLGFETCRWNGAMIPDKFVSALAEHVEVVTTCPEVGIELGVPRDPVRIVLENETKKLFQLNTKKDLTDKMTGFVSSFLSEIGEIDGFLLKDRSPSCGLYNVKVYPGLGPSSPIKKSSGFFGEEVLRKFGDLAVETEGRLNNFILREHFLRKLFTLARFREVLDQNSMKTLVRFHASNKFLLLAYAEEEMRRMGRLVANPGEVPLEDLLAGYRSHLTRALAKPAKYGANINVLMHAMGFFSDELTKKEKTYFLNILEEYRRGQAPLSVPVSLIYSHILRFENEYLKDQTFFAPYPKELTSIKDSGAGRSYS